MRQKLVLSVLAASLLLQWSAVAALPERFSYRYLDVSFLDNGYDGAVATSDGDDRIEAVVGSGDGNRIELSLAVRESLHLFGEYSRSSLDLDVTETVFYPVLDDMRGSFFSTAGSASWAARNDLSGDGVINFKDLAMLRGVEGSTRRRTQVAVGGDLSQLRLGLGWNRDLAPNWGVFARLFVDYRRLDHGSASFFDKQRDFGASKAGPGAELGLRIKATDLIELEGSVTYTPVGDVNVLGLRAKDRLGHQVSAGIGGRYALSKHISVSAQLRDDGDTRLWTAGLRIFFGPGNIFWPVPRKPGDPW